MIGSYFVRGLQAAPPGVRVTRASHASVVLSHQAVPVDLHPYFRLGLRGGDPDALELWLATIDGGRYVLVTRRDDVGRRIVAATPYVSATSREAVVVATARAAVAATGYGRASGHSDSSDAVRVETHSAARRGIVSVGALVVALIVGVVVVALAR